MVALAAADKERVRYHLNYQNIDTGSPVYLGLVVWEADQSVLERNMDNLLDDAARERIKKILVFLDTIEDQMIAALERLQASKADVVTLNPHEHEQLIEQYRYWQKRLAYQLGVQVNPRAPADADRMLMNVRVIKG